MPPRSSELTAIVCATRFQATTECQDATIFVMDGKLIATRSHGNGEVVANVYEDSENGVVFFAQWASLGHLLGVLPGKEKDRFAHGFPLSHGSRGGLEYNEVEDLKFVTRGQSGHCIMLCKHYCD